MKIRALQILSCVTVLSTFSDVTGQLCSDDEMNRNFNAGNTSWTRNGYYDYEMVKEATSGANVYAVKNRQANWAGPIQIVDKTCYSVGDTLMATANILLRFAPRDTPDMETSYECDPGKIWGVNGEMDKVCPTLVLMIKTGTEAKHVDIAKVISPFKIGTYNTMFGEVKVTQEMLDADSVALELIRTEPEVNIYIESVSLEIVQDKCETLITNGDGDVGDSRAWSYFGTDGLIEVTQAPPIIGTHSIWSRYRPDWFDGAQVLLDTDCLELGSLYELSAKVRMKDVNGHVACDHMLTDHTRTVGGERCPVANLAAFNHGGPRQKRIIASVSKDWVKEEFNEIKGQFSFFANELSAHELSLFFNMAPPNVDLILDSVTLTKVR